MIVWRIAYNNIYIIYIFFWRLIIQRNVGQNIVAKHQRMYFAWDISWHSEAADVRCIWQNFVYFENTLLNRGCLSLMKFQHSIVKKQQHSSNKSKKKMCLFCTPGRYSFIKKDRREIVNIYVATTEPKTTLKRKPVHTRKLLFINRFDVKIGTQKQRYFAVLPFCYFRVCVCFLFPSFLSPK